MQEWAKAICRLVVSGEKAFAKAKALRQTLLDKIKSPYDDMIRLGHDDLRAPLDAVLLRPPPDTI